MSDLLVYHPVHGLSDNDLVFVSWLDGNYYIHDKDTNSYKLSTTSGGVGVVEYTTDVSSGYVRQVTSGGSTVISGLDHLEGQTVTLVSGGEIVVTTVVASGSITVPEALTEYIVGLRYSAKIRTTRLEIPGAPTNQTRIKNINETVVRHIRTKDGKAGQEHSDRTFLTELEAEFSNKSKDATIPTRGGLSTDSYITVVSDTPYPMTILAVIISFTVEEIR